MGDRDRCLAPRGLKAAAGPYRAGLKRPARPSPAWRLVSAHSGFGPWRGPRRKGVDAEQLRAARALVGWSREQLAEKSGVPEITTRQFELGKTDPRQTTVHKWRRALEKAGVVFLDADDEWGPGVRLRGRRKD